jgi:hypothetical protein
LTTLFKKNFQLLVQTLLEGHYQCEASRHLPSNVIAVPDAIYELITFQKKKKITKIQMRLHDERK